MRGGALAIALTAIQAVALADSAVDLSTVLAPPPVSDYIEVPASATVLDGPFTAQQYADFLTANGLKSSATTTAFTVDGFNRGYARTWSEHGTLRALVERVFEFSGGSGARDFYNQAKLSERTGTDFKGVFDTSSVPDSFGVIADESGATVLITVFVKGNDVYYVVMGSFAEDLTSEVLAQAHAEYLLAPDSTIPKSQWTNELSFNTSFNGKAFVTAAIVGGGVFVIVIVGLVVLFLWLTRRRSRLQMAPVPLQMSPDGAHWWDGQQWRNASLEVPATARRSPDGAYWWDGRTWRSVPPLRGPSV